MQKDTPPPFQQQQQQPDESKDLDVTPTAATGAVPKNNATVILPSIIVPPSTGPQRGRLGKARSVSPSSSAARERLLLNVRRQSSVPLRFDETDSSAINASNNHLVATNCIPECVDVADRERKVICSSHFQTFLNLR